jgi:hypothetical protein
MRWLMLLFPTKASRLKDEIAAREQAVQCVRADAKASEQRLRGTLADTIERHEKYRPSALAASMGWKKYG